jgi:hypothetical protein
MHSRRGARRLARACSCRRRSRHLSLYQRPARAGGARGAVGVARSAGPVRASCAPAPLQARTWCATERLPPDPRKARRGRCPRRGACADLHPRLECARGCRGRDRSRDSHLARRAVPLRCDGAPARKPSALHAAAGIAFAT